MTQERPGCMCVRHGYMCRGLVFYKTMSQNRRDDISAYCCQVFITCGTSTNFTWVTSWFILQTYLSLQVKGHHGETEVEEEVLLLQALQGSAHTERHGAGTSEEQRGAEHVHDAQAHDAHEAGLQHKHTHASRKRLNSSAPGHRRCSRCNPATTPLTAERMRHPSTAQIHF